jgi:predicted DNA repair protein MutK
MFLVGGGILTHGIPAIHHWVEAVSAGYSGFVAGVISLGTDAVTGMVTGALVLAAVTVIKRFRK